MKKKCFLIAVLILGFFLLYQTPRVYAQKFPKALTLVYSNNINGEIDPCPT